MTTFLLVLGAVIITIAALWAVFTAQRLNTLHIRTDAALAQLQAMLDRRAAVIGALIPSLAPITTKTEAVPLRHGKLEERSQLERELNVQVQQAVASDESLVHTISSNAQLVGAETRVQLAHRFYNEAVADTRALRLRPAVRLFRLGGTAPLPDFFEYSFQLDYS